MSRDHLLYMISIAHLLCEMREMEVLSQTEFNVSQRHRMDYIFYAKEAGERLLEIKELLKGATKTRPVETDLGTYISYSDFLDKNDIAERPRITTQLSQRIGK